MAKGYVMNDDLKELRGLVDWIKAHPSSNARAFWCCGEEEHPPDCPVPAAEAALERLENPNPEDDLGRNVDDYYELGRSNGHSEGRQEGFDEAREMAAEVIQGILDQGKPPSSSFPDRRPRGSAVGHLRDAQFTIRAMKSKAEQGAE